MLGSGKSFVGVALVLALVIIREHAEKAGHSLGPVLMLSYKNHALDEFLVDVLAWSPRHIAVGGLIRTGKADRPELLDYNERANPAQKAAEEILNERISTLRSSRKFSRDLLDAANFLQVLVCCFACSSHV